MKFAYKYYKGVASFYHYWGNSFDLAQFEAKDSYLESGKIPIKYKYCLKLSNLENGDYIVRWVDTKLSLNVMYNYIKSVINRDETLFITLQNQSGLTGIIKLINQCAERDIKVGNFVMPKIPV